ncbi:Hypothetical predicted protein [Pelobates cultripes]|uniref:Uncharacterized protein n=1 Tax=Pelobates cultripes TaxID=61616 RepID=A0AAD1RR14_PELCU|nr:Hypothetical predicted protein [Pelobates cultripes]
MAIPSMEVLLTLLRAYQDSHGHESLEQLMTGVQQAVGIVGLELECPWVDRGPGGLGLLHCTCHRSDQMSGQRVDIDGSRVREQAARRTMPLLMAKMAAIDLARTRLQDCVALAFLLWRVRNTRRGPDCGRTCLERESSLQSGLEEEEDVLPAASMEPSAFLCRYCAST